MQGIDARELLRNFVESCARCREHFRENVAMLTDGEELSDEQVEVVLVLLNEYHAQH